MAKKSTSRKKVTKPAKVVGIKSFKHSKSRTVFDVPLSLITTNPGNIGGYRDFEAIPVLSKQGYSVFPKDNVASDHVLWLMLNGSPTNEPDPELRKQAVHLITECEPHLVEMAQTLATVSLINPIQIVVRDNKIGIESGMVRGLVKSYYYANSEQQPGIIEAYISLDRDDAWLQARATIENLHTIPNRNPMSLAFRLKVMRDSGLSNDQISHRIGMTDQSVRNYLELIDMPQDVKDAIAIGDMTMTQAREIAKVARQTGKDVEDVTDEMSPTRNELLTKKMTKRKPLNWDKIFLMYLEESEDRVKEIYERILQIDEMEGRMLKAEHSAKLVDLNGELD